MAESIIAAVLTGDIINSSGLTQPERRQLLPALEQALGKTKRLLPDFTPEIFQGDSFQGFSTKATSAALKAALYLLCSLLKENIGIRISLGIGGITFESGSSLTSDGPAFLHSGRNMDMLKRKEWRIAVSTADEEKQNEWDVHNASLNYLLERCTNLQAEALVQMLEGQTQQQAAANIGVKQPAIQQRLQAAGWPLLQTILHRFEMQF